MSTEPALGIAAFAVDRAGARWRAVRAAPRLRCASVLKPLLFWAGADLEPFATDRRAWAIRAQASVTYSDNEAASDLWSRAGEQRLLGSIRGRTGVDWRTDRGGDHAWRRVLVTAEELARAYAVFAADGAPSSMQVRAWMRDVPTAQTFGVREVACDALSVPERAVGVKCGWFGAVRAHAVTLVELEDRTLGAAVTSFRPQDEYGRQAYAKASSTRAVLTVHDELCGPLVRAGTRRALQVAADL